MNFKHFVGVAICVLLLVGVSTPQADVPSFVWLRSAATSGAGNWNDGNNWGAWDGANMTTGVAPALFPGSGDGPFAMAGDTLDWPQITPPGAAFENAGIIEVTDLAGAGWFECNSGTTVNIRSGGTLDLGWNRGYPLQVGYDSIYNDVLYPTSLNIFDGGSLIIGREAYLESPTGYGLVIGYGDPMGPEAYVNQTGGSFYMINQHDVTAPDEVTDNFLNGLSIGRNQGGNATYKISGGSMSVIDSRMNVGYHFSRWENYWEGVGNFEIVGSAATINVAYSGPLGAALRVDSRGTIIADVDSTGISTINVDGDVEFLTAGANQAKIKVVDAGAVAGTYTLMTWTGVKTGDPILDAPAGWTMAVVQDPTTYVNSLQLTLAGVVAKPGDLNWDTLVNNQDINPFVQALTDLPGWQAAYPGKDVLAVGDINEDGYFNNQDINPFIALLTGGSAVPEPVTLAILGMGGLAMLKRRR